MKAHDPLGVLQICGHLSDREGGRVGRQHTVDAHHSLNLGEHLLLDADLLEHRLDDEVGIGEVVLARGPADQSLEPVGPVRADPALAEQLVDLGVDVANALVHRDLVEVGHHDRDLEPLGEQHGQLACHQAGADDAHLGDRACQRAVGSPGRALGALLHQVEGVQAAAQLVAHQQVRRGVVLGGVGLFAGGGAGRGYELESAQRCGRSATGLGPDQSALPR